MNHVFFARGIFGVKAMTLMLVLQPLVLNTNCPAPNGDDDGSSGGNGSGDWYRPGVNTTWQWQLQPDESGQINTTYDVDVYDLDLFETDTSLISALHAAGRHVICYFSAGTYEDWRTDADEFEDNDLGNPLTDFADERWLDIRSNNVRRIMLERLDLAATKGCDAVEPDNVDGYANDHGFSPALTAADQLDFNRFIAGAAHERGLGVGLKNDLDQVEELVDAFDFSIDEQCHEYDECDVLLPFIQQGKPVFNAEYDEAFVDSMAEREAMCENARELDLQTLVLPVDLDDSFRISCDP